MRIRKSRRIPVDAKPRRIRRTIQRMRNARHRSTLSATQIRFAELVHKEYFGGKNE